MTQLSRRESLRLAALALPGLPGGKVNPDAIRSRLPRELPPGVAAIIASHLNRTPSSLNTDWHSTGPMFGLLKWQARGITEVREFARAWLDWHLKESSVAAYAGPRSRVFSAGGVAITTYAGHYGLTFPCYEMAVQFGDERARRICLDIARIILHQAARNRLGLVAHDDTAEFAIPDTCYFAASALMFASQLDPANGAVYRDQAVIQLRAYTDTFLTKETGLAKTILQKEGLGKTCWTRASGWLLWATTAVLRHLPPSAPQFAGIIADLKVMAGGYARVQDASGGFHLLLDEPATPLETTGTAMCALGLHEAVRNGWLDASYRGVAERAWQFVCGKIAEDGMVSDVFAAWAVPAERRALGLDKRDSGFAAGFVLCASDEMTRSRLQVPEIRGKVLQSGVVD